MDSALSQWKITLLQMSSPEIVGVIDGAATTVKLTGGLVNADRVAVILAVPTATPVAKPLGEMVATPGLSLSHVT